MHERRQSGSGSSGSGSSRRSVHDKRRQSGRSSSGSSADSCARPHVSRPIAPPASAQSAIAQTTKSASGSATRFTSTRSRAVQLAAGSSAKDWTLILDSHKGAHSLELSPPSSAKAAGIGVSERPLQHLRITEHSKVFEFELRAHPRACEPLAACPSFQASCARASEAEARGGTGAPLPFGKDFGRFRRGKGVAPPPPSLGSRWA